jgi:hypothetical protein
MVLYRPFIHHIVRTGVGNPPEIRSFACTLACIKAARQIIWIAEELENCGLLIGAYWFTVYITFFAVMTLCIFIIGNPDDPTVDDTMRAANKGREILCRLALDSVSAERCVTSLGVRFPSSFPRLFDTSLTVKIVSLRQDFSTLHQAPAVSRVRKQFQLWGL